MEECIECSSPASWIRHTQFAGSHPLCQKHAEEDNQFLVNNSYQVWVIIESYNVSVADR